MLIKNLDNSILISSKIINFIFISITAIFLANTVWWLINPTVSDVYLEKISINQFDGSIKYLINRYPFGTIEQKSTKSPAIAIKIKLTGIYLNTNDNSIAFFELNGRPLIVKVGDKIEANIILKSINNDNVIITDESGDTIIKMVAGSGNSADITTSTQNNNPTQSSMTSTLTNNNAEDTQETRRKLIDEYMHSSLKEKDSLNTTSNSNNSIQNNK